MENSGKNTGAFGRAADEYEWRTAAAHRGKPGRLDKAARALSAALHPFLVSIYTVAVLMFGNTVMVAAPARFKWFFLAMVVLVALVIPALSIGLLRALRLISDFPMERRQDRTIPIAIAALSYGICIMMMPNVIWAFMVRKFLVAAFCCAVAALTIAPFWKISLHMIAAGGAVAIFAVLGVAGIGNMFAPLVIALLLSGALASARLYLDACSLVQAGAGFLLGLTLTAAAMLLVQ